MNNRIISSILSICILICSVSITTLAEEDVVKGYVEIVITNSEKNNSGAYTVLLKEDTLYISTEDISEISGYRVVIGDFISFTKLSDTDDVTAVDIEFDGKIHFMGCESELDIVVQDGIYYLPLAEMLYLLHTQWAVEDNCLVVQQLPSTIIDFMSEEITLLWENRVSTTDLLINGESELGHTLCCSLAAMFNDFDVFDFISWDIIGTHKYEAKIEKNEDGEIDISFEDSPEGISYFVSGQYEEAILQLSVEDEEFLQKEDQQNILEKLEGSKYKQLKADWDDMNLFMEFPGKIPNTVEELQNMIKQMESVSETKISKMFDAFGDLSALEDLPWSKYLQFVEETKLKEALDLSAIFLETAEINQRSKQWGDDFIGQILVLTDFDETGYNTSVTDYIKENARKIIEEKEEPIKSAMQSFNKEILDFGANILLDGTLLGLCISAPKLAITATKIISDNVSKSMNSADLAYMVDCLIKVEHVALIELNRSYEDMLATSRGSGFNSDELERMRNSAMLSLRSNLRNHAFIYYLNMLSNDALDWEETEEAQIIRQQIQDDYVSICNLMETEGYDRLIFRTDLENIFNIDSDEKLTEQEKKNRGDVRQKFGVEIFHEGDSSNFEWIKVCEELQNNQDIENVSDSTKNYLKNLLAVLPLYDNLSEIDNFDSLESILSETIQWFEASLDGEDVVGNIINKDQYIERNSVQKDYFNDGVFANLIFKDTVFDEFLSIINSDKSTQEIFEYYQKDYLYKKYLFEDSTIIVNREGRGAWFEEKNITLDSISFEGDNINISYTYENIDLTDSRYSVQQSRVATVSKVEDGYCIERVVQKTTSEGDVGVQEILNGDMLTVSGVLEERNYEINSQNKGAAFVIKLDNPIDAELNSPADGYYKEQVHIIEIQVDLYDSEVTNNNLLGKNMTVCGEVMYAHTGHHITPILLVDMRIVDDF